MDKYYAVLGVKKEASLQDLKKAQKTMLKKYHPDLYVGDKDFALKRTLEINEAYQILSTYIKFQQPTKEDVEKKKEEELKQKQKAFEEQKKQEEIKRNRQKSAELNKQRKEEERNNKKTLKNEEKKLKSQKVEKLEPEASEEELNSAKENVNTFFNETQSTPKKSGLIINGSENNGGYTDEINDLFDDLIFKKEQKKEEQVFETSSPETVMDEEVFKALKELDKRQAVTKTEKPKGQKILSWVVYSLALIIVALIIVLLV